jgi:hypothetical protein
MGVEPLMRVCNHALDGDHSLRLVECAYVSSISKAGAEKAAHINPEPNVFS